MLNSDIICDFHLTKMLKFHVENGYEATILISHAEDPSKYGVVIADAKN